MKLTPKIRKTLDISVRICIATLSVSYIVYRIYALRAGDASAYFSSVLERNNIPAISLLLFLLMVINWGIESYKWRLLIRQTESVSFLRSYLAVLGGLAVSVFTPNRVGEFLGRAFILEKTDPLKAILLTLVGSFSQLLVTIVSGTIAYWFFAPRYLQMSPYDVSWLVSGLSFTMVALSLVMLFLYFNISALRRVSILLPVRYSERIRNSITAIASCPRKLLLQTLLLSALRYLVFSTQFFLAIALVGLNFTIWQCILAIPVFYLLMVAIPTVALTEIGVRGSVSVFLFGLLAGGQGLNATESMAIVTASTFIWIINIAVPSLMGVLVVFRLKFFRR